MKLRVLLNDGRGTAAIDFAFAMPILATAMIGILQLGLVLQASGAMRHAAGEGIRHAKVHPDASEADVLSKVGGALAGIDRDRISGLELERGTTNGASFARVSMSYQFDPVIPFVNVGPITLSESKFAYLPR